MSTELNEADRSANTRRVLEQFVIENSELETLEDALSEVNLFEAVGAVRSELRHSDFLAFLLDPSQNHGLGDLVLRRITQTAVTRTSASAELPSAVDLDSWDLDDTLVTRESDNIDLFLVNERLQFLVLIENKLDTKEHTEQLRRYRQRVEEQYPRYKKILLFLTVDGEAPSDNAYISITHGDICKVIQKILDSRSSRLGPDVVTLLRHYCAMIGRHFMEDAETARLARSIYQKHKVALDYIFEQRPDLQSSISSTLTDLIKKEQELLLDHYSKAYTHFIVREWDEIPPLTKSRGWTPSGRVLLFEFRNDGTKLQLALIIGPGHESYHTQARQRLFDVATQTPETFKPSSKAIGLKWSQIWARPFLVQRDIEEGDMETMKEKIDRTWRSFLDKDLPQIRALVRKAFG